MGEMHPRFRENAFNASRRSETQSQSLVADVFSKEKSPPMRNPGHIVENTPMFIWKYPAIPFVYQPCVGRMYSNKTFCYIPQSNN